MIINFIKIYFYYGLKLTYVVNSPLKLESNIFDNTVVSLSAFLILFIKRDLYFLCL